MGSLVRAHAITTHVSSISKPLLVPELEGRQGWVGRTRPDVEGRDIPMSEERQGEEREPASSWDPSSKNGWGRVARRQSVGVQEPVQGESPRNVSENPPRPAGHLLQFQVGIWPDRKPGSPRVDEKRREKSKLGVHLI
jgi:hypothetical protein